MAITETSYPYLQCRGGARRGFTGPGSHSPSANLRDMFGESPEGWAASWCDISAFIRHNYVEFSWGYTSGDGYALHGLVGAPPFHKHAPCAELGSSKPQNMIMVTANGKEAPCAQKRNGSLVVYQPTRRRRRTHDCSHHYCDVVFVSCQGYSLTWMAGACKP